MSKTDYKILYFSTHEWSDLWRRRQRLAHKLSLRPEVASVLYINPPVTTSVLDLARGSFEQSHLDESRSAHSEAILGRPQQVADCVWTYTGSEKTIPLTRSERVRRIKALNDFNAATYASRIRACLNRLPGSQLIVYLSHPLHAFALGAFKPRALAYYDWTDDWTQFELIPMSDRQEYAQISEQLPSQVDLVFAVSQGLYQRAQELNTNAYWLPNATSLLDLNGTSPELDLTVEKTNKPRLGYMGQIGDRVDFDLLDHIARARPNWSIIMIGPVWSNRVEEAETLGRLPNIHFIGPRAYNRLPSILGQLDICLIPHTLDALTASMDPIKLYDYLATGKPIVTTPVAGVDRFADAIYIAETPDTFIAKIESALAEPDNTLTQKRLAYGNENSWSARADQLWTALNQVLDK